MMTFQVDIAQRSKERPAWIVLQQVACLNWLLGESPSHPAHIPSFISVTHPLSTLYPRCSHDFLAIVFESMMPPLSHKIKFTTKWFKLLPAANSIGKWQHLELQEEEEVGKEKEMFPMCTICSSLYVTLSVYRTTFKIAHLSNDTIDEGAITVRPTSNCEDWARCPRTGRKAGAASCYPSPSPAARAVRAEQH